MPTVLRLDGLRVVIYPADHRPAHVHVIGAKGEAVFVLNCPDGPPSLRESYGFSRREELRIQKDLLRQWEELPLTESVNLSVGVFGKSFLTGEPQRLLQGFLDRKK